MFSRPVPWARIRLLMKNGGISFTGTVHVNSSTKELIHCLTMQSSATQSIDMIEISALHRLVL
jgi:hypothetical protein